MRGSGENYILRSFAIRALYSLRNIIRAIKLEEEMRWIGHMARVEEKTNSYGILVWKGKERTWDS